MVGGMPCIKKGQLYFSMRLPRGEPARLELRFHHACRLTQAGGNTEIIGGPQDGNLTIVDEGIKVA
jgi:hypothetical protein